jgi:hypothetical protein
MAPINMSVEVYAICQETFGRPAIFASTKGNSYSGTNRGIYKSDMMDVPLEDGSIFTQQCTILDIRAAEYPILPVQDDFVSIPAEPVSGLPDLGSFQIIDVFHNGGGEVTLQLRAVV